MRSTNSAKKPFADGLKRNGQVPSRSRLSWRDSRSPFAFHAEPLGWTPNGNVLLDPIDGTRGIMYDKRSAWALSGIAPQRGEATRLSDIVVAAMTELPTRKQWRADQVSAMRGGGLVASAVNVMDGSRLAPLARSLESAQFSAWIRMDGQVFPGRPRPHGANRGTTLG